MPIQNLPAVFLLSAAVAAAGDLRIENSIILTSEGDYHWSQSRPAVIPGHPFRVVVTIQEIEKRGSHGYRDIYFVETTDGAKTWSAPKQITALDRRRDRAACRHWSRHQDRR